MNCASSEIAENSKGFDCRNMGEVLGKECEKDEPSFAHSSDYSFKDVGVVPASPGGLSESESEKELSSDSDEDISWLLSFNADELTASKCMCEGCLRRNESYNNEKKNAKLLLTSWKEFQSYIRNVYINSPCESSQTEGAPIKENDRLNEILQILRLCDPYQLFQKIEDEVRAMVLQCLKRQLSLLKDESNPTLAEDFIAGLVNEYVKVISSALQLSSPMNALLGSQFQKLGFTWDMLNKHLYQSLVFTHKDVQENLLRFMSEIHFMDIRYDLFAEIHINYLEVEQKMISTAAAWEEIEPHIQEYKNAKAREMETLNSLQNILRSFFGNKVNAVNGNGSINDPAQYCPNCLTRRGCPCDECTVTHMLSCEGLDSPSTPDSPDSRSRSPVKDKDTDSKEDMSGEEEQSCECHACTVPPPELMDCSAAFNQLPGKNTHGEGFQLYPHIHGTVVDSLYETENISNFYTNIQATPDSVYPHLYNLHNQNSIGNISQMNATGTIPNRTQLVQPVTISKVQPQVPVSSPPDRNQLLAVTSVANQFPNSVTKLPPPPPNTPTKPEKTEKSVTLEPQKKTPQTKAAGEVKLDDATKVVLPKESDAVAKAPVEKPKLVPVNKPAMPATTTTTTTTTAAPCVKPSACGDACTLKHAANGVKTACCGKKSEKRRAAIARLGLARNANTRSAIRCPPGKESEHTHKPGKGHLCGKLKPHDVSKKITNGKVNGQEMDDSSSQDDTCSERSNSASAQRDSRHCDCCYCEVFGHNGPSVAPVSRNYQEMRERLRIRLNMKKSAECKAVQGQPGDKTTPGAPNSQGNTANDGKQKVPKEKDLESLLKFIEGKTREECKDPKRIAKRARQKQRKQEEKERMEEEEAERKRLEAMKKQVTISVVNDNNKKGKQQPNKQQQQQQQQQQPKSSSKQNNRNNSNSNNTNNNNNQPRSSQTLNLSGLKSLVEKPDPNSGPKMVTIRRVTAPFSAEPTVTITLKGSTPDKDKVLFMLKNGSEAYQPEEKETTKKKRKRKKSKKEPEPEPEYYEEEEEEEPEPYYEEEPEQEKTGRRRRRRNRKKAAEAQPPPPSPPPQPARNNKKESKKTVNEVKNSKNSSKAESKASVKQNASQTSSSKAKNVPVLKAPVEKNAKEANKKNNKANNNNNAVSVNNSKSSVKSTANNNNNKNNEKQSATTKQKTSANQKTETKQVKNKKVEETKQTQVKGKETKGKTVQVKAKVETVQKKQDTKQAVQKQQQQQQQQQESVKKAKNSQRTMVDNDMSSRFTMGGAAGCDRGKVVINTPSYRLSEVLSSIAPPPPPKEEINLENLRLPPGITITKIEGPITKSVRPNEQPLHVSKPVPVTPPIVVSTPTLKQNHPPPPGNVIVVDTGRLKEVIKENPPNPEPQTKSSSKRKKKKNKQNGETPVPAPMEVPVNPAKLGLKLPKNNPLMGKSGLTVISADEARKMVPNLENQQATIIKTSDNMVTIRSPAFQQAMNMQAYHNSPNFRPGINGYNNVSLFQNDVNRITDSIGKLKIHPEDKLARQMSNLNIKDGSRASQIFAQAMAAAGQNGTQETTKKKKKKKRKSGNKGSDEKEVEPVESVFQPKDIDLENGDIDDDERELEAFKRFCLQSVPSERKNKVKVNLNIKDIVLKKKSSAIGCS